MAVLWSGFQLNFPNEIEVLVESLGIKTEATFLKNDKGQFFNLDTWKVRMTRTEEGEELSLGSTVITQSKIPPVAPTTEDIVSCLVSEVLSQKKPLPPYDEWAKDLCVDHDNNNDYHAKIMYQKLSGRLSKMQAFLGDHLEELLGFVDDYERVQVEDQESLDLLQWDAPNHD